MKKVTVYTTTTCPYCIMVKRWLDDNKITYTEHLVDRDRNAAEKMVKLSGQMGVPFTTVEDDAGEMAGILGFNVPALQQSLQTA